MNELMSGGVNVSKFCAELNVKLPEPEGIELLLTTIELFCCIPPPAVTVVGTHLLPLELKLRTCPSPGCPA